MKFLFSLSSLYALVSFSPTVAGASSTGSLRGNNSRQLPAKETSVHNGEQMDCNGDLGCRLLEPTPPEAPSQSPTAEHTYVVGAYDDNQNDCTRALGCPSRPTVSADANMEKLVFHCFDRQACGTYDKKCTEGDLELCPAELRKIPIACWDTSKVTSMKRAFSWYTEVQNYFNEPLTCWDTSSVTDMSYMFHRAERFNQPIDHFITTNVKNMKHMFMMADSFNQPLTGFDTSQVTNMESMFTMAYNFNQPLVSFDTSKVTNMAFMFDYAKNFNQPLASFDTSKVTNMEYMFDSAEKFNQPIDGWDVSSVTSFQGMFLDTKHFDQSLDNWDISGATNLNFVFARAEKYGRCLHSWAQKVQPDAEHLQMFVESPCETIAGEWCCGA